MVDESCGSLDTEMPDMAAEPPTLEEEDSPPVIDDDDGSPVSEAPIGEDEDVNERERQVEEPDLVTKDPREIESDQLRRRLTTKQSRKFGRVPELSLEGKEEMEQIALKMGTFPEGSPRKYQTMYSSGRNRTKGARYKGLKNNVRLPSANRSTHRLMPYMYPLSCQ